ncbi:MAG: hypothetical protein AVDCRST_MAG89-4179, partial [uncultured Gemmatimonadetes bacterium]
SDVLVAVRKTQRRLEPAIPAR